MDFENDLRQESITKAFYSLQKLNFGVPPPSRIRRLTSRRMLGFKMLIQAADRDLKLLCLAIVLNSLVLHSLHSALCTLYPAPCALHSALYTTHPALCTLHSALRTPHSALRTPHSALRTPHSALRTPHSALRTPHSALRTPHSALRTPHSALRTPHSALRTPHSALCKKDLIALKLFSCITRIVRVKLKFLIV